MGKLFSGDIQPEPDQRKDASSILQTLSKVVENPTKSDLGISKRGHTKPSKVFSRKGFAVLSLLQSHFLLSISNLKVSSKALARTRILVIYRKTFFLCRVRQGYARNFRYGSVNFPFGKVFLRIGDTYSDRSSSRRETREER